MALGKDSYGTDSPKFCWRGLDGGRDGKEPTVRSASAQAKVVCSPAVMRALREGTVPKGDVLAVARVAGIAAAKKVPDLLPRAYDWCAWRAGGGVAGG